MAFTGFYDYQGKEIHDGDDIMISVPDRPYVVQGNGWMDVDVEEGFEISGTVKYLHDCWFIDRGDEKGVPLDFEDSEFLKVINKEETT